MDGQRALETIKGTVEGVVFHSDATDYTVLELSCDGVLITAVGEISEVCEGEILELLGSWTYHREFGKQFAFVSYEKSLPSEIEGIIQYLSSRTIKGVGPVTALKIVNRFGADTFEVIEHHPEWLTDIPGITMKKAAAISESFRAQSELRDVMLFFKDYVGSKQVGKIYKKLGSSTVGVVKHNPYVLCSGEYLIPFEAVDKIAASIGFLPTSPERVLSGLKYVLSYNASTNGHTCLPKDKLSAAAVSLLEIDKAVVDSAIEQFLDAGELSEYSEGDDLFVMTNEVAEDEDYISKRLSEMIGGIARFSRDDIALMIESMEHTADIRYAELQRAALYCAMESGVTVITGGPGTGKTTIVKAMIKLFEGVGFKTVLSAPTGRAAKRLSEATGHEAKTVHRMLEMERTELGEVSFRRNISSPLEESVVIVDEASMMDLTLTAALVRAMRRGSRLILIGDSDQLPSVGAGNVLADIIASGTVPTICLKEIFRQSENSLIIQNAHLINSGKPPVLNRADNDFFFLSRPEGQIADTVASLIFERLPKAYGEQLRDEIQVITPSKKGAGGVELLNAELQKRLNPPTDIKKEKQAHGTVFREGDRVMQTTNNYELEWEKNGTEGIGIFNGDIGVIESIDHREGHMLIRFDERLVSYPYESLDELELSYAITVHKSQGSEYPVVIIPMYYCAPMLMTRNLLYTAVTRARKMVILVGRREIAYKMVENNRVVMRYTTLCHRLVGRGRI